MLARAQRAIGAPEALAALTTLARTQRREIAGWLALIETIVRKLLFAEAVELHRAERARAARGPRLERVLLHNMFARVRTRAAAAPSAIDYHAPHTWPARFRLAPPSDVLTLPECRAPRLRALWGPSPPLAPSRPLAPLEKRPHERAPAPLLLALRLEALRRVLAGPAPYVRRLARLLKRLRPAFAERYALSTASSRGYDDQDARLIVEALALALAAAAIFLNSS